MPGDTSCSRFARITTTAGQREALRADRPLWETLVNQMVAHNRSWETTCEREQATSPPGRPGRALVRETGRGATTGRQGAPPHVEAAARA